MKAAAIVLLFVFCSVECGRKYVPINKNANIDFINMEAGGVRVQPAQPAQPVPKPVAPVPTTKAPVPAVKPVAPPSPTPAPKLVQSPVPAKPIQPVQPSQPKPMQPTQPKPATFSPLPAKPVTTPGPGSVQSLINYYDSQGKGSVIRPYSYSQAVKQGKKP